MFGFVNYLKCQFLGSSRDGLLVNICSNGFYTKTNTWKVPFFELWQWQLVHDIHRLFYCSNSLVAARGRSQLSLKSRCWGTVRKSDYDGLCVVRTIWLCSATSNFSDGHLSVILLSNGGRRHLVTVVWKGKCVSVLI